MSSVWHFLGHRTVRKVAFNFRIACVLTNTKCQEFLRALPAVFLLEFGDLIFCVLRTGTASSGRCWSSATREGTTSLQVD